MEESIEKNHSVLTEKKDNNARARDRVAGFAAGIASGATKLFVGHPFDTVKVRMQVEGGLGRFKGPWDCFISTLRREKVFGLYKGATPPLVGWAIMDAVQLGTLSNLRLIMQGNDKNVKLSSLQHAIAGVGAGWAVALVATPVELTKIRLQIQYAAYGSKEVQQYNGAIDCIRKIVKQNGITGMWYGLPATIMQRSFFFFLWGSYDVYSRWLRSLQRIPEFPYYARQDSAHNKSSGSSVAIHDRMSERAISFIAGGLAANTFWTLVYPVDVAKNKYMASSEKKYKSIFDAAKTIFKAEGIRGFYRGFVPGFIRSFPTNGAAVFVWDTTMRFMVGHGHS